MAIFELGLAVRSARALAEGASEDAAMAGRTTERRGTAPGRLVGRGKVPKTLRREDQLRGSLCGLDVACAKACKGSQEIGKAFSLDENVQAQSLRRSFGIARDERVDDTVVLAERRRHPIPDSELKTAIGTQTPMHRRCLLDQEVAVAAGVNGIVKIIVFMVIGIRVRSITCGFASLVRAHEERMIGSGHAARGKPAAHRLALGHYLDHLQEPLCRPLCA